MSSISNKEQLKVARQAKELCNEAQQVCFQISKSATIITFDSRKRSKRAEGNPHAADMRKSSSPELDKNRHFCISTTVKNQHTFPSADLLQCTMLCIFRKTVEGHFATFVTCNKRQTKLENDLFYGPPLWHQPASPHCLHTIKHWGIKALDKGSCHSHCYKQAYTGFLKKVMFV